MWQKIRVTVSHRLHQRRAILANRDIQRDMFPPIYHGLWHGLELLLIENESCICHKGRLVLPKPLQSCAVMWYHHYLQHPGHTRLEEMMKSVIYWKGMKRPSDQKWSHARLAKWIMYTKAWDPYHLKSWLALHGRLFVLTKSAHTHWLIKRLHGSHHDWSRFQQFEIVE